MKGLTRRRFVGGVAAATAVAALPAPSVHAQKRGGTMRFVAPLLDDLHRPGNRWGVSAGESEGA